MRFGRKVISTPSLATSTATATSRSSVNVNEEYEEDAERVRPVASPPSRCWPRSTRPATPASTCCTTTAPPTRAAEAQAATAHPDDQAYLRRLAGAVAMLRPRAAALRGRGLQRRAGRRRRRRDGDGRDRHRVDRRAALPAAAPTAPASCGDGPDGRMLTMASAPGAGDVSTRHRLPQLRLARRRRVRPGRRRRRRRRRSPWARPACGACSTWCCPSSSCSPRTTSASWNTADGQFEPGFPAQMNDLMFFNTPAIADVTGDGQAEVLQSSAMYDLRAYGSWVGVPAPVPKFTGGWSVVTPARRRPRRRRQARRRPRHPRGQPVRVGHRRGRLPDHRVAQVPARPAQPGRLPHRRAPARRGRRPAPGG